MLAALLALITAGQEVAARPQDEVLKEDRCTRTVRSNGIVVIESKGSRVCEDFQPQRVFDGLWVNHFEGSAFFEGAHAISDLPKERQAESVWFTTDRQTRFPKIMPLLSTGHIFRVRFRGRAVLDMHRKQLEGYGHFGMSSGLVLADEILAIEDLGPAPRD